MVTSPVTVVPIEQIFDIAQARSTLRTKIAQQRLPIMFNARAAAVLTALGELILESRDRKCAVIKIEFVNEMERAGVKLYTNFCLVEDVPVLWGQRIQNLKRAASDTEMHESDHEIEIITYVWVE